MKKLIIYTSMTVVFMQLQAQNRRMPIYDMPVSAQSLALGGSRTGMQQSAYIYSNPSSAFLEDGKKTTVDYSFGVVNEKIENMYIHTLTAAHRSGSHLIMGGIRYYAQGEINNIMDEKMQPVSKEIRLYAYTADLGYAHKLGKFSVYGSFGLASEKSIGQMNAYRVNLGGIFYHSFKSMKYMIGVGIRDLGVVSYQNKNKPIAPLLHAGSFLMLPTWRDQTISLFVDGGVYISDGNSKTAATFSGGLDYTFAKCYSLRMGGHTGDNDNYMSAGLGVRMKQFTLDASVKLACENDLSDIYMIGIKLPF